MVTYVTMVAAIVERLEARLPRSVYVLQAGLVVNAFGNGAANPFILLYLHDARGIPLAAAGLAGAANAACALGSSLVGGAVADRLGPRATVVAGLALATATFLAYPLVTTAWEAVLAGALVGTASGGWLTGQSVLLATLVPPDKRHIAFAQQRVAANLGLGLGGLAGGLVASAASPRTFDTLFVLNALTFAVYGAFVARLRIERVEVRRAAGGYRLALRDRALLRVLAIDATLVAGAVALLNGLVPVYARDTVGVREGAIGVLFLFNCLLVVGGQLSVARAVEGRRRSRAFALMACLFASCWLLVLAAGPTHAFPLLLIGIVAFSGAECIYDSVRAPLVADLAPPGLSGRYLASAGISWQLGFIVGPAVGAALLGLAPTALWATAATVCVLAALAALRLDRVLPAEVRITPRPER
jgi:MFS family permease